MANSVIYPHPCSHWGPTIDDLSAIFLHLAAHTTVGDIDPCYYLCVAVQRSATVVTVGSLSTRISTVGPSPPLLPVPPPVAAVACCFVAFWLHLAVAVATL